MQDTVHRCTCNSAGCSPCICANVNSPEPSLDYSSKSYPQNMPPPHLPLNPISPVILQFNGCKCESIPLPNISKRISPTQIDANLQTYTTDPSEIRNVSPYNYKRFDNFSTNSFRSCTCSNNTPKETENDRIQKALSIYTEYFYCMDNYKRPTRGKRYCNLSDVDRLNDQTTASSENNIPADIPFTATPSCCCSNESKPEYHQIDYLSLGLNPVGNDHNSSPNSSTTRDLTLHLYNASVPHPSPLTPVTLIQSPTPDKTQKTFLTRKKRPKGRPSKKNRDVVSKSSKSYMCTYPKCEHSFTTSGHLSRHMRLHGGVVMYSCPIDSCKSAFNRRDNMLSHLKSHAKKMNLASIDEIQTPPDNVPPPNQRDN